MESRIAGIDSERSDVNATKIITPPAIPLVQQRNEESYGDLSPDLKVPFPAIFPETRPWTQSNVEEPENGIVQSQKAQENRMGSRRPQPDAPKLRELADAATAASNTRGRPSSGDGPIATSSKSESSKRGLAKEHPHKSLLAKISNMMAKSITNGAASESLQKAVLRALLELEDNRNIITTADSHSETASKANLKGRNPGKLPPRFSGPDGTELNISTAEVREGLAAMSRGIKKAVPKPKTTANTKTKKMKCPDCSSSFNRQCDLRFVPVSPHTSFVPCLFRSIMVFTEQALTRPTENTATGTVVPGAALSPDVTNAWAARVTGRATKETSTIIWRYGAVSSFAHLLHLAIPGDSTPPSAQKYFGTYGTSQLTSSPPIN